MSKSTKYDFGGWATKNDLRCSDGRIIRRDAFKDNDGQTVPLVWNHQHNEVNNVLGHAVLENRKEGVYAYCSFNETEQGLIAKDLVRHGDIKALSIYANQLKQQGPDVIHGMIREVSLVLAGANAGATIESVLLHSDGTLEEGIIYPQIEEIEFDLEHTAVVNSSEVPENEQERSEQPEEPEKVEVKPKKGKKQSMKKYSDAELEHAENEEVEEEGDETIEDVFNTLNDKQKTAVYALVGKILEDNGIDSEGEEDMKHNAFDTEDYEQDNVLSHSELEAIFSDAKRYGSLKESILQHGIDDIEYLFPEAKNLNTPPEFIKREDAWVSKVMKAVHHTPFSRIKSMFADITEADARAKGYIKGNRKIEEVFGLLKRSTTPTTVYKKQKLDRDDVIDITDFDVVAWLKSEMRVMLDEELARAFLIGDGRNAGSDEKINEQNIRPIWTDDDLFSIKVKVNVAADATEDDVAKAVIRAIIRAHKFYKGKGNPSFYMTEDFLTSCLLLEDEIGHPLYDSESKLATKLRVSELIPVPVMENQRRVANGETLELVGIIVNLDDYNVGADKGGAVSMFDDFDIDYNAQKYLIETRCSGALIKPYSAIVVEISRGIFLKTEAEDSSVTVLGKSVSDLQSNVFVHDDYITGNLAYVTGYTGFSGDASEQEGNYLALKFEATEGATTQVELVGGSVGHPVTLDSDMNCVLRITNKYAQKVRVTSTKDGVTLTNVYSLKSLKCESN